MLLNYTLVSFVSFLSSVSPIQTTSKSINEFEESEWFTLLFSSFASKLHNSSAFNFILLISESVLNNLNTFGNYIFYKHPDKVKLRQLNWKNTSTLDLNNNYDYISYHWYSR